MDKIVQDLLEVLDLERLEDNLFRGQSRDLGGRSVFGGQVLGQGMVAASRTVGDDRPPHSLHAYFLRPGDMSRPIIYEVDNVRDGRSFSTRRVQAIQHGAPILTMMVSFQVEQPGMAHQLPMPQAPDADSLPTLSELRDRWAARHPGIVPPFRDMVGRGLPMDIRPVTPADPFNPEFAATQQMFWFRAQVRMPDTPWLHRCVLAYASDYGLLSTSLLPHRINPLMMHSELRMASIDHALWFHREARVDDWLLYTTDTPSSQGARGLARGLIFDRHGGLVASVAQEGMIRLPDSVERA